MSRRRIGVGIVDTRGDVRDAGPGCGCRCRRGSSEPHDPGIRSLRPSDRGAARRAPAPFLWIDGLPDARRREALQMVQRKELSIERLETRENGREIDVPGGMIHHWVGTAFVPGSHHQRRIGATAELQRAPSHLCADCRRIQTAVTRRRSLHVLPALRHEEGDHGRDQQRSRGGVPAARRRSRRRMDPQHAHRRGRECRARQRSARSQSATMADICGG